MKHLTTKRNMQCLVGWVVTLSQCIWRLVEKCLSFKMLRQVKKFEWLDERQLIFESLKEYLESSSPLSKLMVGEELYMYLSISPFVINLMLAREDIGVQKPIHYTRKSCKVQKPFTPRSSNWPILSSPQPNYFDRISKLIQSSSWLTRPWNLSSRWPIPLGI